MAVIVMTGATGFIGRQLQRQCVQQGHQVRALSRADLAQDNSQACAGADCVMHLAARAHVLDETESDPAAAFRRVNLELTQKIFRDAAAAGVSKFVFMSSAGVLGNSSPPGGFNDDSKPNPHDEYSRSKLAAEEWLLAQTDSRVVRAIIRPPLVHGPGARGNFGRIFAAARRGIPLPVGALNAPRSMIGLRNLCDLTLLVALDPRASTATYLATDAETLSVRELTIELRRLFGRSAWVPAIPVNVLSALLRLAGRGADVGRLTLPIEIFPSRARASLGWRPPYSVLEELSWAVSQAG